MSRHNHTISLFVLKIFYFKVPDDAELVTIEASSDKEGCAIVSVQNNTVISRYATESYFTNSGQFKQCATRDQVYCIMDNNFRFSSSHNACTNSDYTDQRDIINFTSNY